MAGFVPSTPAQRHEMLEAVGYADEKALFAAMVPKAVPSYPELALPKGKGELDVRRAMSALADKNRVFPTVFRGAGAYRHYIPAVVGAVTSNHDLRTYRHGCGKRVRVRRGNRRGRGRRHVPRAQTDEDPDFRRACTRCHRNRKDVLLGGGHGVRNHSG